MSLKELKLCETIANGSISSGTLHHSDNSAFSSSNQKEMPQTEGVRGQLRVCRIQARRDRVGSERRDVVAGVARAEAAAAELGSSS
jgi:hypothetical protein